MSEVGFWILLANELVLLSAHLDDTLATFFRKIRKDDDAAAYIPPKVSYKACQFYGFKNPVMFVNDGGQISQQGSSENFLNKVVQDCMEETNRVLVNPSTTRIHQLAKHFSDDRICLVIEIPNPLEDSIRAIGQLRKNHATLFRCLQVTVKKIGNWQPEDVRRNLQGGIFTDDDSGLPPEFKEIQQALAHKRVYKLPQGDTQKRDFQNARSYKVEFDSIFTPGNESFTVTNSREYVAFYNVLRCYHKDVVKITGGSSSLKASNITVHFIQPPFLSENNSSGSFVYHQEKSWSFPIFVDSTSARNVWCKFSPRSDWMVVSPSHAIPFVISEVISQQQETDRSKMLVEAIALARAGNALLQPDSKRKFFVVAIYINADLVASRYIVMQTGRGDTEHTDRLYHDEAVCIHRKDFELTDTEKEVDFLREMYNLATQIAALAEGFDQEKKANLTDINTAAKDVISLSSHHTQAKTGGATAMDAIAEEPKGSREDDDLGVFEADDIQNILREMEYKVELIPWGHPRLAVIVSKVGDKYGYLKFVERQNEINILRYLMEIDSPSNHTISGVRFWPVRGGTVISMPVAGGWLTSLDDPSKQLWSVALQLFEAVAFMHEHNVAHMDLKPQNIIIPVEGGRLSIIDFSVSIRLRGPDVTYSGIVGTEDYMAPEIRKGHYKPMLADLWSCGRTLRELCLYCGPSSDRTMLLGIARRLMNRNPEARPKMSTVLQRMTLAERGEQSVASSTLGFSPDVPPLCA